MAAIIAQMNIRNRARKKRSRENKDIPSSKSTYELPPFDQTFELKVHNRYFRNREKIEAEKAMVLSKFQVNLIKNRKRFLKPIYSLKIFILESFIIGEKHI